MLLLICKHKAIQRELTAHGFNPYPAVTNEIKVLFENGTQKENSITMIR